MQLETKLLILRAWIKKDIDDLVEGLNNLHVTKWLAFAPFPYTKKDATEWIDHCITNSKKKNRDSYEFAVVLKSEQKSLAA